MPELPEVHTTVEGLKTVIIGKQIIDVWSDFYKDTAHGERQNIKNKSYFEKFRKLVTGAKIKSLERKGKNILIHLNNPSANSGQVDYTVIVHMKMTGCLMYKKDTEEKYLHLIFTFKTKDYLLLSDLRKFASVSIIETNLISKHETLRKLGPDPLHPKFNQKNLLELIQIQKNTPIKSALLNQNAIVGIGNIYSDEILYLTGIHPLSLANKIPKEKFREIFQAMQKILKFSIKHGGDSKSDYRNAFGEKGGFQNFHQVYGRRDEKCQKINCSGIIERMVVRGRSAHFCPKHQIKYT